MTSTQRRVATSLAKTLMALDRADWHARDWVEMQRQIRAARVKISTLFTSTGYEFAQNPPRVKIRRPVKA